MGIYKVGADGKSPSGLKVGDLSVTGGGTYRITGVNPDGSYTSEMFDPLVNTSNYKGNYDTISSGSSQNENYSWNNGGNSSSAMDIELPEYQEVDTSYYEDKINDLLDQLANSQYTPINPEEYTKDVMTYEEAYDLAKSIIEPQYASTYRDATNAVAQNLDRAGIYNSLYGQSLMQNEQNRINEDMNARLGELATTMQGQERDYALQLLNAAINENQFGSNYNQNALTAAANTALSMIDNLVARANNINDFNYKSASLQLQRSAQALEEQYMNGQITQMELENKLLALQAEAQELDNKISAYEVGGSGGSGSGNGSRYVYNQDDTKPPQGNDMTTGEKVVDVYNEFGGVVDSHNDIRDYNAELLKYGIHANDNVLINGVMTTPRDYWYARKSELMDYLK